MSNFEPLTPGTNFFPFYIVMEGIDGSGKGTQVKRMKEFLEKHGKPTEIVTDPGANGHGCAMELRKLLLDKNVKMTPEQQLLLYTAARIDARDLTSTYRRAGKCVVGDRYLLSTLVYQGKVYGNPEHIIMALHHQFVKLLPDVTIYIDVSAEVARDRLLAAKQASGDPDTDGDRHEHQGIEFAEKLRKGYKLLAEDDPYAWTVDGEQSEEDVFVDILEGCKLKVPGFEEFLQSIK